MKEGISEDTAAGSASKEKAGKAKDKDRKELGTKSLGLLGKAEASHKEDTARKLFDSPLLEQLIPKAGKESKTDERSTEVFPLSLPTTEAGPTTAKAEATTAETVDEVAEEAAAKEASKFTPEDHVETVVDRIKERREEVAADKPANEAEAIANEASLEYFDELEKHPDAIPKVELDDIDAAEGEGESVPVDSAASAEQAPEAAKVEDITEGDIEGEAEIPLNATPPETTPSSAETAVEDEDDDPATSTSSTATPPPSGSSSTATPPPAGAGSGRAGAGGGPPAPPYGPPSPATGGPGGPGGPGGGASFNTMPLHANPNAAPVTIENNYYDNVGGALFAGAILGYLLGRRRGRIKTEKRLKAVSKKLEKQIVETRRRVDAQEQLVRQAARDRYNAEHTPVAQPAMESLAARTEPDRRPVRAEQAPLVPAAKLPEHSPEKAAERVAKTGMTAERVQRLSHAELLGVADKVVIDGTSLRTIYESKQITEPGLRRIAHEYLKGGDVKAALQGELLVKEMTFERDPQLRDRLAAGYAQVDAAGPQESKAAMAGLLGETAAHATTDVNPSLSGQSADNETDSKKPKAAQQALVSAWVALVAVLVIVVVILLFR